MKTFNPLLAVLFLSNVVLLFPSDETENSDQVSVYSDMTAVLFDNVNPISTFDAIITQETHIFLIGNNSYRPETGYSQLSYCQNDVKLLRALFVECCKIDEQNIIGYFDMTLRDFKLRFNEFIKTVDKDSLVVFYYSGHGDRDGSLIFTDGEKLNPSGLRSYMNSFSNDTVMIIDACYSGRNEGSLEFSVKEQPFKFNCLRLYSSLAHLTAKEISYENPFFGRALPFYRNVLGLEDMTGNGYFTALIGLFFAQYKFRKEENISYLDLVSYITNKGKDYAELLNDISLEGSKSAWEESIYRTNQHPKIYPVDEKISFFNKEHEFIILQNVQRKYWPEKNHFAVLVHGSVVLPMEPVNKSIGMGFMPTVSMLYNLSLDWGIIGAGILTGAQWAATHPDVPKPYTSIIYPLAIQARFSTNLYIPVYFGLSLEGGICINQLLFDDTPGNNVTGTKFYSSFGLRFGFNPARGLGIEAAINYALVFPYNPAYGFLAPGIDLIFTF